MKKYVGLLTAVLIALISLLLLEDSFKILGIVVGLTAGLMITIMIIEVQKRHYIQAILYTLLICFAGALTVYCLRYYVLTLPLEFRYHDSYAVDISEVKNYVDDEEGVPFACLLQLETWRGSLRLDILEESHLVLSEEVLRDIDGNNLERDSVLLSFGREIEEIRYFTSYGGYKKGAVIRFSEEYQDNTIYVYYTSPQFFYIHHYKIGDVKLLTEDAHFGNAADSFH